MTKSSGAKRLLSVVALALVGVAAPVAVFAQADTPPTTPPTATPPETTPAPGTPTADTTAPAKIDAQKEKAIRELIVLSGQEQLAKSVIPRIIGQSQSQTPDAPAG